MAKWRFYGFDNYIKQLEELGNPLVIDVYLKKAIWAGADVVEDATKEALINLPVDNRPSNVDYRTSINQKQKNGLIDSYGCAPPRYDGTFLNVKVGFDGYNDIKTKRWPQGQPNVVIARSLESGTSFMKKNPVISRTERKQKKACLEAMQKSLNETINQIMK